LNFAKSSGEVEQELREEICRVGRSLFERGYVHSSAGNISVRLEDGYLITPTDAVMGFLEPSKISKVGLDAKHISGDPPSKTLALHQSIYSASRELGLGASCVIHTHSTHCVALTLLDLTKKELLEPITPYLVMKVGRVPVIEYARPGDPGVATRARQIIAEYAEEGSAIRALMLARLGPLVWHDSPAKAMATLEELEESAKLSFLVHSQTLSTPKNLSPLNSHQIQELKDFFKASW
jgi:3-dehydro-4-phosphotetronate decarboxylase